MDNAKNNNNTCSLCKLCTHNIDGFCTIKHFKVEHLQATTCKHFDAFIADNSKDTTCILCTECTHRFNSMCMFHHQQISPLQPACKHFDGND